MRLLFHGIGLTLVSKNMITILRTTSQQAIVNLKLRSFLWRREIPSIFLTIFHVMMWSCISLGPRYKRATKTQWPSVMGIWDNLCGIEDFLGKGKCLLSSVKCDFEPPAWEFVSPSFQGTAFCYHQTWQILTMFSLCFASNICWE